MATTPNLLADHIESSSQQKEVVVNEALDTFDQAIAGILTKALSGSSVTLTTVESRYAIIKFTGTLSSNFIVTLPSRSKYYTFHNATSGAFTLTVKTSTGNSLVITQGTKVFLYCDGTDTIVLSNSQFTLPLSIQDSSLLITGSSDGTKKIRFEVDGLTTGTTRVITAPDSDTTLPIASQVLTLTGPTVARTITLPDADFTVMGLATVQSPTYKTIDGATNVLGSVTMGLGSDATGDIYYRNGSGRLARLAIGTSEQVLSIASGVPTWAAAGGSAFSGCKVRNSADQSIANATNTAINFDTELYDNDNYHSTVSNTNRLTVPTSGKYRVSGTVRFASNNTGMRLIFIRVNGTTSYASDRRAAVQSDVTDCEISTTIDLVAGDYVELMVQQSSGGALNITAVSPWSPSFTIEKLAGIITGSVPVIDSQAIISGSSDGTKLLRFEVDGLTTGTTRVATMPDANIVIAGSASALTSGRMALATTGGLLIDSTLRESGGFFGFGTVPSYPMNLDYTSTNGTPIFGFRSTATSLNTATATAYHTAFDTSLNVGISTGQTNSGYQRGQRTEAYAGSAHAGTTADVTAGYFAAYIDAAAPVTAVISAAYGIRSATSNNKSGATITNAYAVHANSTPGVGTITNAYDFYGANASGRNVLLGQLSVGVDGNTSQLQVHTASASRVGAIIRGAASQSANLQEWQNSAGTVQAAISKDGWFFGSSVNGNLRIDDTLGARLLYTSGTDNYFQVGGGVLIIAANGAERYRYLAAYQLMRSDNAIVWNSTTTLSSATPDVGLYRNAAGVLEVNNATVGTYRDLKLRAIELVDGNVVISSVTGTKFGTATTQKLAFYNATPIVQPSTTGTTVGFTAGAGTNVTDASTFTGNVGSTAYRVSDIVKALKDLGLIAQ